MPLLKRRPVPLLPLPALTGVASEAEVFFLKATGEIFLDYESYAARLAYLYTKVFQCEFSGKSNLDYFAALESERVEARIVRERFPDELKGKVLGTVQFQVMGRLDALVDLVYERYKERFFTGEKVFVDLDGDKYFARISKVFPPAAIRALLPDSARAPMASTSASSPRSSVSSSPPPRGANNPDTFDSVIHTIGTDLSLTPAEAIAGDDPNEYAYTVSLMDEEHKFEGSYMEVKAKTLSRDRLAFSKSILKRYIRECVQRDALIASPWIVKPLIAVAFGIPTHQSEEVEEKNKQIREGKLAKRRKIKDDTEPLPLKRRRTDSAFTPMSADRKQSLDPRRPLKYPIEDLELDPMSIHDGRVLRRVNSELPTLPPKPVPNRDILVPKENFDTFLTVWNMVNVFSKPLSISAFSLDDFASALTHDTLDPRCILLAEIHGCLTNVIATDPSRVLGSTGATRIEFEAEEGEEEMAVANDEDELDKLIRHGLHHSKRWDRMAKLKNADGRLGWERHLIGALCQRGGPIYLPNLRRILAHLFEGADFSAPKVEPVAAALPSLTDELEVPASSQLSDLPTDTSDPAAAYLTLALEDKLDILSYLCTLASGSKLVRSYIEESESQLTEYRKQRADVNKDRRALLEQKTTIDGKPVKGETPSEVGDGGDVSLIHTTALQPLPSEDVRVEEAEVEEDEDEEDQLEDDDDDQADPSHVEGAEADYDSEDSAFAEENGASGITVAGRRLAIEEKRSEKKAADAARSSELAKARSEAKALSASRKEEDRARNEWDDGIKANNRKDDLVEREFRRWQGVPRCRPLGKDRFFNRYWWFDGVGGMSLVEGGFGTGRLFIQGPCEEDWTMATAFQEDLADRRLKEEVDPKSVLQVDEWGFYEQEEELDALQGWLNGKGVRELQLKNSIAKWRGYILAGSRRRQSDSSAYRQPVAEGGRRSTRSKNEPDAVDGYLGYKNWIPKC